MAEPRIVVREPQNVPELGDSTHLSHQINRSAAHFMLQIVPLDQSNTVLASGCTLHLNSAFDHAVDEVFCEAMFLVIIEKNSCASQSRAE